MIMIGAELLNSQTCEKTNYRFQMLLYILSVLCSESPKLEQETHKKIIQLMSIVNMFAFTL